MNIYNRNRLSPLRNDGLPRLELRRGPEAMSASTSEPNGPPSAPGMRLGGTGEERGRGRETHVLYVLKAPRVPV